MKFFVATLDEEIIGCIGLTDGEELTKSDKPTNTSEDKIASVWRLTVSAPYRKYAVGRRLMMYCEDFLQKEGYTKITLLAGNIDSINFYSRLKYKKTHLSWEKGYHQSWFFALDLPRNGETLLENSTSRLSHQDKKND